MLGSFKVFCYFFVLTIITLTNLQSEEKNSVENAKYVFLFIGDGMGANQVKAADLYLKSQNKGGLSFCAFPSSGTTTTHTANNKTTDSAAAGTAIACGKKTNSGIIGMGPDKKENFKSIAEIAKEKGLGIGIITSVSLDHATPASFYAHVKNRGLCQEISDSLPDSGFDYFAGGGFKKEETVLVKAKAKDYKIIRKTADFKSLKPEDGKVLIINEVLAGGSSMPYELDRKPDAPTLADYTEKAIEMLEKNPKGFFIMVEGGKIDWAGHANDPGTNITETIALGNAVRIAENFLKKHPDETLIVVTADHETGGMELEEDASEIKLKIKNIGKQKVSKEALINNLNRLKEEKNGKLTLQDVAPMVSKQLEISLTEDTSGLKLKDEEIKDLEDSLNKASEKAGYGKNSNFANILLKTISNTSGITFSSKGHTGTPVITYAKGKGNSLFQGDYDNTDIFKKIVDIYGFQN